MRDYGMIFRAKENAMKYKNHITIAEGEYLSKLQSEYESERMKAINEVVRGNINLEAAAVVYDENKSERNKQSLELAYMKYEMALLEANNISRNFIIRVTAYIDERYYTKKLCSMLSVFSGVTARVALEENISKTMNAFEIVEDILIQCGGSFKDVGRANLKYEISKYHTSKFIRPAVSGNEVSLSTGSFIEIKRFRDGDDPKCGHDGHAFYKPRADTLIKSLNYFLSCELSSVDRYFGEALGKEIDFEDEHGDGENVKITLDSFTIKIRFNTAGDARRYFSLFISIEENNIAAA